MNANRSIYFVAIILMVAGLMAPESGTVFFDGRALNDLDDVERARLRAGRIGVVLQSGNLIPFLTASENVELAIEFTEKSQELAATSAPRFANDWELTDETAVPTPRSKP